MFCSQCGTQTTIQTVFCSQCGAPTVGANPSPQAAPASAGPVLTQQGMLDTVIMPVGLLSKDAAHRLGIGTLISLIPLLGQVFVCGYALRWTKRLLAGEQELPRWDDWWDLFWEGSWSSLVAGVFGLLPITGLMFWVTYRIACALDSDVRPDLAWGALMSLIVGLVWALVIIMVCMLPAPIAVCAYARHGRVLQALALPSWLSVVARAPLEFLGCWVVLILAGLAALAGGLTTGLIPLVGPLVSFICVHALSFVLVLSGHALFARYYLRHADPG
jgi:Protein of unknown function (DUF4013)